MNKNKEYKKWLETAPASVRSKLRSYKDENIEERFGIPVTFGTAGMRGRMGLGTSCINEWTIASAAWAYGKYLISVYGNKVKTHGVLIAHDNRNYYKLFTKTAASVLSALGIKVRFFHKNILQPTPLLSYSIQQLEFIGGINITASHNPPTDNGFKVYNHNGKQLDTKDTKVISKYMDLVTDVFSIKMNNKNIGYIDNEIIDRYVRDIFSIAFNRTQNREELKVVFTPQHGTALPIAQRLMDKLHVSYKVVEEQATEDPMFTNTVSANPQDPDAFILAEKYGNKFNADILFSTDPDADRFGVMVKHKDKWIHIDGNQLPAIQLEWKLRKLKELERLTPNSFIVRSVVTSNIGDKICAKYGVEVFESLTGFKHIISEVIREESKGRDLIFAYEESFGSTIRSITKDKDSFQSLVQVIEIAHELKLQGKTLIDAYRNISKEFGNHEYEQIQIKFPGKEGMSNMLKIIDKYKEAKVGSLFGGLKIKEVKDFSKGYKKFPKENFVTLSMGENSVTFRPSGTEPILRIYMYSFGNTKIEAQKRLKKIKKAVLVNEKNIK